MPGFFSGKADAPEELAEPEKMAPYEDDEGPQMSYKEEQEMLKDGGDGDSDDERAAEAARKELEESEEALRQYNAALADLDLAKQGGDPDDIQSAQDRADEMQAAYEKELEEAQDAAKDMENVRRGTIVLDDGTRAREKRRRPAIQHVVKAFSDLDEFGSAAMEARGEIGGDFAEAMLNAVLQLSSLTHEHLATCMELGVDCDPDVVELVKDTLPLMMNSKNELDAYGAIPGGCLGMRSAEADTKLQQKTTRVTQRLVVIQEAIEQQWGGIPCRQILHPMLREFWERFAAPKQKNLLWPEFVKYFGYFLVDKFPDLYRNEEDLVNDGLWGKEQQLFMKRFLDPHDKDRVHFSVMDKRFGSTSLTLVEQMKRLLLRREEELDVKKLMNAGLKIVIQNLRNHMHIERVVEHCCTALKKISFNSAMQTKVAQGGAIPLVLEAMERYIESANVSEQGAACLGKLAQLNEVNQKAISDLGGTPVLVNSCVKHPSCRELTYQTVQALEALTNNIDVVEGVAQCGGIDIFITAMTKHPKHVGIQEEASAGIRNLCMLDFLRDAVTLLDPVPLIIAAIQLDRNRDLLQRNCMGALNRLTSHVANRMSMIECNGLPQIYLTMKAQSQFYGVLVSGCATIHNMCKRHDTRSKVDVEAAVTAVWEAQRMHPLILGVQIESCSVLKVFSAKSNNHPLLTKKEGLNHVFLCLKEHHEVKECMKEVAQMVRFIVRNDSLNSRANWVDQLGMLCRLLKTHSTSCEEVARHVVWTFAHVTTYVTMAEDIFNKKLIELDIINLAINSAEDNPQAAELTEGAMSLLRNLMADDEVINKCIEGGCTGPMVDIIGRLETFPKPIRSTLQCLNRITTMRAGVDEIELADGMGNLLQVLSTHAEDRKVEEEATTLLRTLMPSRELATEFANEYGCEVVAATMEAQIDSPLVQQQCCGVLRRFASNPRYRGLASESDVVVRIIEAIKAHIDVKDVVEDGLAALRALSVKCDEVQDQIVEAGGIPAVVAVMNAHPLLSALQDDACFMIYNVVSNVNMYMQHVGDVGTIPALVAAIRNHLDYPRLHEKVIAVLSQLTAYAPNRDRMVDADAVKLVVDAVRAQKEDPKIITVGASFFRRIGFEKRAELQLFEDGAVALIIEGMTMNPKRIGIQEDGFGVLLKLPKDQLDKDMDGEIDGPLKAQVDEWMEVVRNAFKVHLAEPRLLVMAAGAARRMNSYADYTEFVVNHLSVRVARRAVALRPKAMLHDEDWWELSREAVAALAALSRDSQFQHQIIGEGCLDLLFDLVEAQNEVNEDLVIEAMRALVSLAFNEEAFILITRRKGLEFAMKALVDYAAGSELITALVFNLLTVLIEDWNNLRKFQELDGPTVVHTSLKLHLGSLRVQNGGLGLLRAAMDRSEFDAHVLAEGKIAPMLVFLSGSAAMQGLSDAQFRRMWIDTSYMIRLLLLTHGGLQDFLRDDGVSSFALYLQANLDDKEVATEICTALACIVHDSLTGFYREIIVPLGFSGLNFSTIVTVMRNFDDNPKLLRWCCVMGGNLCMYNEFAPLGFELKFPEAIVIAMEDFVEEYEMQEEAMSALSKLAGDPRRVSSLLGLNPLDAVLAALAKFMHKPRLAAEAVTVLWQFVNTQPKMLLGKKERIMDLVSQAMLAHRKSGCWTGRIATLGFGVVHVLGGLVAAYKATMKSCLDLNLMFQCMLKDPFAERLNILTHIDMWTNSVVMFRCLLVDFKPWSEELPPYLMGTMLEPWQYFGEAPVDVGDGSVTQKGDDMSMRSDISDVTFSDSEDDGGEKEEVEELMVGFYEDERRGCDMPINEEVGESRLQVIITRMGMYGDCFPLQLACVRLLHRLSYVSAHRHQLRYSRIVAAVVRAISIWNTSDDLLEQGFGFLHNILNNEDRQRCLERCIVEDEDALTLWNNTMEEMQRLVPLDMVMIGIDRCKDPDNGSPFTFVLSLALYRDIESVEKYYKLLLSIADEGGDSSLELVDHLCKVYHLDSDLYQLRDDEVNSLFAEATRALHMLMLNIGDDHHPNNRSHFEMMAPGKASVSPWMHPNAHWSYYGWNEKVLGRIKRFVLTEGVEKVMLSMKRNQRVISMQWSSFELLSQLAFLPRVKADLSDYGLFSIWMSAVKMHMQVPSVIRGAMAVLPHMIQRKQAQDQFLELCRKEMPPEENHSSGLLIQIMDLHKDDCEIIQLALGSIVALCLADKFRMEMQTRHLIKYICQIADRYKDNDRILFEVYMACTKLIEKCRNPNFLERRTMFKEFLDLGHLESNLERWGTLDDKSYDLLIYAMCVLRILDEDTYKKHVLEVVSYDKVFLQLEYDQANMKVDIVAFETMHEESIAMLGWAAAEDPIGFVDESLLTDEKSLDKLIDLSYQFKHRWVMQEGTLRAIRHMAGHNACMDAQIPYEHDHPEIKRQLLSKGYSVHLIQMLTEHADEGRYVVDILMTLWAIQSYPGSDLIAEAMMKAGIGDKIKAWLLTEDSVGQAGTTFIGPFCDDYEFQLACVRNLGAFAGNKNLGEPLLELGSLPLVLHVLRQNEDDGQMVGACMFAVAQLARCHSAAAGIIMGVDADLGSGMLLTDSLDLIYHAISTFTMDEIIQRHGVAVIRAIARRGDGTFLIPEKGFLELALVAMKNFATNRFVQLDICNTLWNICTGNASNRRKCGSLKAVEMAIACIKHFLPLHDTEVFMEACTAVEKLAAHDEDNTQKIGEQGGIKLLADSMNEFATEQDVQQGAMTAMRHVMVGEQNEALMREHRCLDAVLRAMSACKDHVQTQSKACGVLYVACYAKDPELREAVRDYQGIFPMINWAMKLDPKRAILQQDGCGILIALDMKGVELIDREDSVRMLCSAMFNHATIGDLQSEAVGALLNLIGTGMHDFIRNEGAIGLTVRALVDHVHTETLCDRGIELLQTLAISRDNEFMMQREGAVEAIKDALDNHSSNAKMQVVGCSLLRRLIDEDEFNAFVGKTADAETTINNLRTHMNDPLQCEAACTVLQLLVRQNVDGKVGDTCQKLGAMALVVECLEKHENDVGLYTMGLGAMAAMVPLEGMTQAAVENNALETALNLMKKHPDNVKIQESCCGVIGVLSRNDDELDRMLRSFDPISEIVTSLERHDREGLLHEKGFDALLLMLRNPELGQDKDQAVIRMLMDSMDRNAARTALQQAGCQMVVQMCERGRETMLVDFGAIERVMTAMKAFLTRIELQKIACVAFQKLVFFDKNDIILRDNGVKLIVDCMVTYSDALGIQLITVQTFNWLSMKPVYTDIIGKAGGISSIMGSVRSNQGCAELAAEAIMTLMHLCCSDEHEANLKELKMRAGITIVDLIVKQVPEGHESYFVTHLAAAALMNKLLGRQRHKEHVIDKVNIRMVAGALKEANPNDFWLFSEAADCLFWLAQDFNTRPTIDCADADLKEIAKGIVGAMQYHPKQLEVQECGMAALKELCLMEHQRINCNQANVEKVMATCCAAHNGVPPRRMPSCIEEYGCIGYWELVSHKKIETVSTEKIRATCSFMLPAMAKWPANTVMHDAALATCKRFCVDATQGRGMDAPTEYLQGGLIPLALEAIMNHPGSRDIQYYSVTCLNSVVGSCKYREQADVPQVSQIVVTVTQVVRKLFSDSPIAQAGLWMLLSMFANAADLAEAVIQEKALDMLVAIIREYPVTHPAGIAAEMQIGCMSILAKYQFTDAQLQCTKEDLMRLLEIGMHGFRSKRDLQLHGMHILRYCFEVGANPAVFLELTRHDEKPWDRYDKAGTICSAWRSYLKELQIQRDVVYLFRRVSELEGSMSMFMTVDTVVATCVATIKTHNTDHECTTNLIQLISNISVNPQLVEAMVAQGLLDYLFKMLQVWEKDPTIIMTVFVIMKRFVAANSNNRDLILSAGAAQIIQNIVNGFASEPMVQQRGMEAINMLFQGVAVD